MTLTSVPALLPLPFPLRAEDEPEAIRRMASAVSFVRDRLDTEYGLERLEELLMDGLREGELDLCVKAYEAGYEGDSIADRALRKVGAELQTAGVLSGAHPAAASSRRRWPATASTSRKRACKKRFGEASGGNWSGGSRTRPSSPPSAHPVGNFVSP
jgi:hypothetical protein